VVRGVRGQTPFRGHDKKECHTGKHGKETYVKKRKKTIDQVGKNPGRKRERET